MIFLPDDNDDDIEVPPEIEEIIEQLLQAIRSPSSDIRWSTAKGLGRITSRLPKAFGDEVVESIIDIFNPLEPNEGWHGACLSIAELGNYSSPSVTRIGLFPHCLTFVPYLFLFFQQNAAYYSHIG